MITIKPKKKNETWYEFRFKHSQVRELQEALLYHIDTVMIPFYEKVLSEGNNFPLEAMEQRIKTLQCILEMLNKAAGEFVEE